MAVQLDNLHYDFRAIDGYNKPFNFIASPRELGKTSMMWMKKIYLPWKNNHKPWIYLVRQSVEITSALIDSINDTTINKFTDDNVEFWYKTGAFKDGIVDVFIVNHCKATIKETDENGEEKSSEIEYNENILFFRIVSLSIQLRRIKLAVLKNIAGVFMDEYIINPKLQEKYLPDEAMKIKEAYTTWRREADGVLKFYIVGNPYTLFNPLFVDWDVDVGALKIGNFYVGNTYVIHFAPLSDVLIEYLKSVNPLFDVDHVYAQYALYGKAINDQYIRLGTRPKNYFLQYVFFYKDKYLGIFQNRMYDMNNKYFIEFVDEVSARRTIFCVELDDLVERAVVLSLEERNRLNYFKDAFRSRKVVFKDINCYYFFKEIYNYL